MYFRKPFFGRVITVRDRQFDVYLSHVEISNEIERVARNLMHDYKDSTPIFLGILHGSFMFFSDLMKEYRLECEVGFLKASSYLGMESTGKVKFHEAGELNLEGRDIILVEDIVDTGNTLKALHEHLGHQNPKSIRTCTLLFKKEAYKQNLPIDYVCFEVDNKFLLGYGLDYDGLGRNLPEVYILKEEQ